MTQVNTAKVADHRTLRFETIDDLLAEIDRIVEAERAGPRGLRRTGNWSTGQIFGHLASWINYAYEGFPAGATPPRFVKVIVRLTKKRWLTKPMPRGFKIPRVAEGTFGTEEMTTEEGARRLREALERLKRREPAKFHSPAFGPATDDERIAGNLRHAELHLGFLHP